MQALDIVMCCDADALITMRQAGLLGSMRPLVERGLVKIPKGIIGELAKAVGSEVTRQLKDWEERYRLTVDLDLEPSALALLPGIELRYGPRFSVGGITYAGFWRGGRRDSRDGEVVALARALGWRVVSNDHSVHGACLFEGIECLRWESLARAAGFSSPGH